LTWANWEIARSNVAGISAARTRALAKARALELAMAKQVQPGDSIAVYCGEIIDSQTEDEELSVAVPPPYWVAKVLKPLVSVHPGLVTRDNRKFKKNEPYFIIQYYNRDVSDPMMFSLEQDVEESATDVASVESLRGNVTMTQKTAAVAQSRGGYHALQSGDRVETCFRDGSWVAGKVVTMTGKGPGQCMEVFYDDGETLQGVTTQRGIWRLEDAGAAVRQGKVVSQHVITIESHHAILQMVDRIKKLELDA
jgi:hypothetical protein